MRERLDTPAVRNPTVIVTVLLFAAAMVLCGECHGGADDAQQCTGHGGQLSPRTVGASSSFVGGIVDEFNSPEPFGIVRVAWRYSAMMLSHLSLLALVGAVHWFFILPKARRWNWWPRLEDLGSATDRHDPAPGKEVWSRGRLLLLAAAAALLVFWYWFSHVRFLLYDFYEGDDALFTAGVRLLCRGMWSRYYYLSSSYGYYLLNVGLLKALPGASCSGTRVLMGSMTAIFGFAVVAASSALAFRLYGRLAALVTAVMLSVCPVVWIFSLFQNNMMPAIFFLLASAYAAVVAGQSTRKWPWLLASAACLVVASSMRSYTVTAVAGLAIYLSATGAAKRWQAGLWGACVVLCALVLPRLVSPLTAFDKRVFEIIGLMQPRNKAVGCLLYGTGPIVVIVGALCIVLRFGLGRTDAVLLGGIMAPFLGFYQQAGMTPKYFIIEAVLLTIACSALVAGLIRRVWASCFALRRRVPQDEDASGRRRLPIVKGAVLVLLLVGLSWSLWGHPEFFPESIAAPARDFSWADGPFPSGRLWSFVTSGLMQNIQRRVRLRSDAALRALRAGVPKGARCVAVLPHPVSVVVAAELSKEATGVDWLGPMVGRKELARLDTPQMSVFLWGPDDYLAQEGVGLLMDDWGVRFAGYDYCVVVLPLERGLSIMRPNVEIERIVALPDFSEKMVFLRMSQPVTGDID